MSRRRLLACSWGAGLVPSDLGQISVEPSNLFESTRPSYHTNSYCNGQTICWKISRSPKMSFGKLYSFQVRQFLSRNLSLHQASWLTVQCVNTSPSPKQMIHTVKISIVLLFYDVERYFVGWFIADWIHRAMPAPQFSKWLPKPTTSTSNLWWPNLQLTTPSTSSSTLSGASPRSLAPMALSWLKSWQLRFTVRSTTLLRVRLIRWAILLYTVIPVRT